MIYIFSSIYLFPSLKEKKKTKVLNLTLIRDNTGQMWLTIWRRSFTHMLNRNKILFKEFLCILKATSTGRHVVDTQHMHSLFFNWLFVDPFKRSVIKTGCGNRRAPGITAHFEHQGQHFKKSVKFCYASKYKHPHKSRPLTSKHNFETISWMIKVYVFFLKYI